MRRLRVGTLLLGLAAVEPLLPRRLSLALLLHGCDHFRRSRGTRLARAIHLRRQGWPGYHSRKNKSCRDRQRMSKSANADPIPISGRLRAARGKRGLARSARYSSKSDSRPQVLVAGLAKPSASGLRTFRSGSCTERGSDRQACPVSLWPKRVSAPDGMNEVIAAPQPEEVSTLRRSKGAPQT